MQHKFEYHLHNEYKTLKLSMVVKGDDSMQPGMAKTVGLPVFFACKLILDEKISLKGLDEMHNYSKIKKFYKYLGYKPFTKKKV